MLDTVNVTVDIYPMVLICDWPGSRFEMAVLGCRSFTKV